MSDSEVVILEDVEEGEILESDATINISSESDSEGNTKNVTDVPAVEDDSEVEQDQKKPSLEKDDPGADRTRTEKRESIVKIYSDDKDTPVALWTKAALLEVSPRSAENSDWDVLLERHKLDQDHQRKETKPTRKELSHHVTSPSGSDHRVPPKRGATKRRGELTPCRRVKKSACDDDDDLSCAETRRSLRFDVPRVKVEPENEDVDIKPMASPPVFSSDTVASDGVADRSDSGTDSTVGPVVPPNFDLDQTVAKLRERFGHPGSGVTRQFHIDLKAEVCMLRDRAVMTLWRAAQRDEPPDQLEDASEPELELLARASPCGNDQRSPNNDGERSGSRSPSLSPFEGITSLFALSKLLGRPPSKRRERRARRRRDT